MRHFYKKILNWTLPTICVLCHGPTKRQLALCLACEKHMPAIQHGCEFCALPLKSSSTLCANCLSKPPAFKKTTTLFHYIWPYEKLITGLKFNKKLNYAQLLGELFVDKLEGNHLPELIIPIPLHRQRLRERGFNQAVEIARPISKALNIPIDIRSCIRCKATKAQSSLTALKRAQNIKNAFQILQPIEAKHVTLLDDVMTTGVTANELAQLLKRDGVAQIDIWCVARAG